MLLLYNTLVFGMYVIRERERRSSLWAFHRKENGGHWSDCSTSFSEDEKEEEEKWIKVWVSELFSEPTKRRLLSFACLVKNEQKMAEKWSSFDIYSTFFVLTFQSVMNKVKSNILDNLEKYVHLKMLRTIWCHTFKNACPLPFWKMIDKIAATGKSTVPSMNQYWVVF